MDSKWLEILKASGWQTTALTLAFGIFIILVKKDVVPTGDDPLWIALPMLGFLICGFLALTSIFSALINAIKPAARIDQWRFKKNDQKKVKELIPYMTDQDKAIIGYLLHHNQKMFNADQDGGYAAPLISKGIVRMSGQHGQVMDMTRIPFEIPDHIWKISEQNSSNFPYSPPPGNETEVYPWAIPWMVR